MLVGLIFVLRIHINSNSIPNSVFMGFSTHHKGFKCLDVSSGHVYILRDVVFDENIFPFSTLHSNAGARLRSEILLLPSSMTNYNTTSPGGTHVVTLVANIPLPSNNLIVSDADDVVSGENGTTHEQEMENTMHGDVHGNIVHGEAALESTLQDSSTVPDQDADSSGAASAAASGAGGDSVSLGDAEANGAAASGEASSADSQPVQPDVTATAARAPRPHTRLLSGIRKEKIYIDMVVLILLVNHKMIERPQNNREALGDKNWIAAMQAEYDALIKNDTWHLVPYEKGQNIIGCK